MTAVHHFAEESDKTKNAKNILAFLIRCWLSSLKLCFLHNNIMLFALNEFIAAKKIDALVYRVFFFLQFFWAHYVN